MTSPNAASSAQTARPKPITVARKPSYITVTTDGDFFEVFKKVQAHYDNCFMLESLGEESYISRYSLIGFDPEKVLWAEGTTLFITQG